jgi:hypothetical protein
MSDASTGERAVHGDGLVATVERHEGAPDECTISPRDANSWDQLTRWLAAEGDSFVLLQEMR